MNNVVLTKTYGQHERGRMLAAGGVLGEKLVRARIAIPVSDKTAEALAKLTPGGVPKVPEDRLIRMMTAYEKKQEG